MVFAFWDFCTLSAQTMGMIILSSNMNDTRFYYFFCVVHFSFHLYDENHGGSLSSQEVKQVLLDVYGNNNNQKNLQR